jgi:hypothetical protein
MNARTSTTIFLITQAKPDFYLPLFEYVFCMFAV